jgi:c-di-GMP-related signal transduction protein
VLADAREALVPCVDFIKIDIKKVPLEEFMAIITRYANKQCPDAGAKSRD